ncbi:hypothetical protein NMG60_11026264 [Bertholletia excelsa]
MFFLRLAPPNLSRHHSSATINPYPQRQNARGDTRLAMRDLTLGRIAANRLVVHRRSHSPKFFCPDNAHQEAPMADEAKTNGGLGGRSPASDTRRKDETVKLPPPPEKPEPGDCCGSGCVRCVWDVYYEELEAYDKLLAESKTRCKDDSESK